MKHADEERSALLQVEQLVSGYGKRQVVRGVTLRVDQGEIVALIGHNGAGKSTLLKTTFGLIPVSKGRVTFEGQRLAVLSPRELLKIGIAYIPQGNRVFSDLSVYENLEMGGVTLSKQALKDGIERAIGLFPRLGDRLRQRAGKLSGGEKQMLALANALVLSPRMLLLDEPSLGLASALAVEVLQRLQRISQNSGVAILVVEQKVREILKIAHRVYVLRNGQVSFAGRAEDLADDAKLREVYL